jgi:hypothetical protein
MNSAMVCMTFHAMCDQVGPQGVLQLLNVSGSNGFAGQLQAASIMLNGSRSSIRTAFLTLQGTPTLRRAQRCCSCRILVGEPSHEVMEETHLVLTT